MDQKKVFYVYKNRLVGLYRADANTDSSSSQIPSCRILTENTLTELRAYFQISILKRIQLYS